MDMNALAVALAPHLLELIAGLLSAVIGWAAMAAKRRWNIEVEARHREALHSALMTGARMALDRALSPASAADLAIGYAQVSVPDAIRALRPSSEVLVNLARAKVAEAAK